MPILSNIVWVCALAFTLILLLAPSAHAQLGDDPKYLTEFQCNDKHNTVLRFRCASVKTDEKGNKLCEGDSLTFDDGSISHSYDPCKVSTCLGVMCTDPQYKYLMQLYKTVSVYNYIIPRSSTDPRCGCSAAKNGNSFPKAKIKVYPDSPGAQADDKACKSFGYHCSSIEKFAHSPSGGGDDCECCDKPTDKLYIDMVVPPLDVQYTGCVPNDVDPTSTNPNNAHSSSTTNSENNNNSNNNSPDEFVSMVHKMCGSVSVSVADDVLTGDAGSFCCSFATGSSASTASCGLDVVNFVRSFTISAEAQCQFNVTDHPFSCCATVGAQGSNIVNKGAICTSGSGGRGDGVFGPCSCASARVVVAVCIMLSVAWFL